MHLEKQQVSMWCQPCKNSSRPCGKLGHCLSSRLRKRDCHLNLVSACHWCKLQVACQARELLVDQEQSFGERQDPRILAAPTLRVWNRRMCRASMADSNIDCFCGAFSLVGNWIGWDLIVPLNLLIMLLNLPPQEHTSKTNQEPWPMAKTVFSDVYFLMFSHSCPVLVLSSESTLSFLLQAVLGSFLKLCSPCTGISTLNPGASNPSPIRAAKQERSLQCLSQATVKDNIMFMQLYQKINPHNIFFLLSHLKISILQPFTPWTPNRKYCFYI